MATSNPEYLIATYLRRLDAAAAALPSERRSELLAEIREHIDAALREAGANDEVTVRNVLERLGPPEEIAAATAGDVPLLHGERGHDTWVSSTAVTGGHLTARLGIGVLIANVFLSTSNASLPDGTLTALPWLGGLLIVAGFILIWCAGVRSGTALMSVPVQSFALARELVGYVVLVAGVVVGGAVVAGDRLSTADSIVYMVVAVAFVVVGSALAWHIPRPAARR